MHKGPNRQSVLEDFPFGSLERWTDRPLSGRHPAGGQKGGLIYMSGGRGTRVTAKDIDSTDGWHNAAERAGILSVSRSPFVCRSGPCHAMAWSRGSARTAGGVGGPPAQGHMASRDKQQAAGHRRTQQARSKESSSMAADAEMLASGDAPGRGACRLASVWLDSGWRDCDSQELREGAGLDGARESSTLLCEGRRGVGSQLRRQARHEDDKLGRVCTLAGGGDLRR